MPVAVILLIAACAYLLGSIPAGYLAGRATGVDIRQHGSGNVGATNVLRVLGKRYGYGVFFIDALKGFLAVRFAYFVVSRYPARVAHAEYYAIAAAALAIIGHIAPVWLRFHGGKGVATAAGALFGLMPIAAGVALVIWIVTFEITRYVSLASAVAAVALPIVLAVLQRSRLGGGSGLLYFSIVMAVLIVWRHRSNFARIRAGTEHRFERK